MIENVLNLEAKTARRVMVPRPDVVYLSLSRPLEDNLRIARQAGHTRYPLCVDDLTTVIGMIHVKDLFRAGHTGNGRPDLRRWARQVPFLPESLRLDQLLVEFQRNRVHLAMLLDEYGSLVGMVSLENVLEELVGPIQDEFDRETPQITPLGDGVFEVDATCPLDVLAEECGVTPPRDRRRDRGRPDPRPAGPPGQGGRLGQGRRPHPDRDPRRPDPNPPHPRRAQRGIPLRSFADPRRRPARLTEAPNELSCPFGAPDPMKRHALGGPGCSQPGARGDARSDRGTTRAPRLPLPGCEQPGPPGGSPGRIFRANRFAGLDAMKRSPMRRSRAPIRRRASRAGFRGIPRSPGPCGGTSRDRTRPDRRRPRPRGGAGGCGASIRGCGRATIPGGRSSS